MRLLVICILVTGFTGCGASYIPGTVVPDTDINREIHSVVEAYRQAMERRDVERLQKLVSRRYYENSSTTDDNADDYGFSRLNASVLPKLKDNVKKVQYRILLRNVSVHGSRATAEYEYYWKFLYSEGGRENWVASNDFNRLDLVRENGAWKIAAGL